MKEYKEVLNNKVYTLIDVNEDESFILVKECKCSKCGELLRLTEVLDGENLCEDCNEIHEEKYFIKYYYEPSSNKNIFYFKDDEEAKSYKGRLQHHYAGVLHLFNSKGIEIR